MPVVKSPDGKKTDGEPSDKKIISRLDFTVQFCWIPTAGDKRLADDPLKAVGTPDGTNPSNAGAVGTTPQTATGAAQAPGTTATLAPSK